MKRLLSILLLLLLICGSALCQDDKQEDQTNGLFLVGFGGSDFKDVRMETALGVELSDRVVVLGHVGASEDGESRAGLGASVKVFETETSSIYLTGAWNPEQEQLSTISMTDTLMTKDWNLSKLLWGGAFYYKPINLGLYIKKNDDLTSSGKDAWEYFVFYTSNFNIKLPW